MWGQGQYFLYNLFSEDAIVVYCKYISPTKCQTFVLVQTIIGVYFKMLVTS